MNMTYVIAKKCQDGRYRLFYRGTTREVCPGASFPTAAAARSWAAVA
jgi:hypothetical protein